MTQVTTVLGPVDSRDLGFTLAHEHIQVIDWSMRMSFPDWYDVDETIEVAVVEVKMAMALGVRSMIDATTINMGRDPHVLRAVAERSGVNLIASTGLYFNEENWQQHKNEDQIVKFLMRDIEKGMAGTDIKAGMLKCGTDFMRGLTEINRFHLRVAAALHRESGLPLFAHSSPINDIGPLQQAYLCEHGVRPEKLVMGHYGDFNSIEDYEKVLKHGSFVGIDRCGDDHRNPVEYVVDTMVKLIERGWIERLLLSHDFTTYIDWDYDGWVGKENIHPEELYQMFNFVPKHMIPIMKRKGLTQEQIETITVANPRRLFEL